MNHDPVSQLERIIKSRDMAKIQIQDGYVPASVMIILNESNSGYEMLFIKRPENPEDPFSGHMAFPGGRMDEGETILETAVRETIEEIGVDIGQSGRVIGELDDFNPNNPRAKNYIVTPFISILIDEVELTPNIVEVEKIVWVPLHHLLDKANTEVRLRDRNGVAIKDYVYYFENYVIWGMTGKVLNHFISITRGVF